MRLGISSLPLSFGNPFRSGATPTIYFTPALFDGLTRIDKAGALQPWLAVSWEAVDQNTWRIHDRGLDPHPTTHMTHLGDPPKHGFHLEKILLGAAPTQEPTHTNSRPWHDTQITTLGLPPCGPPPPHDHDVPPAMWSGAPARSPCPTPSGPCPDWASHIPLWTPPSCFFSFFVGHFFLISFLICSVVHLILVLIFFLFS